MDHQNQKIVLITGANKGLGYALLEKIVQQYPQYKVILTARNPSLGEEARKKLIEKYPSAKDNLFFYKLDIKSSKDQDDLFDHIKSTYHHIDILVNNAGVSAMSPGSVDKYDDIVGTNYHGTVDLTEKLLPLLADDARVIMISSILGKIAFQLPEFQDSLTQSQTTEQINEKLKEIEQASSEGKQCRLYCVSKAFLNAYSRWVLAPKLKADQSVIAVHPGYCETDCSGNCGDPELSKMFQSKTAEEGTKAALYVVGLDTQKAKELSGSFVDDETKVMDY